MASLRRQAGFSLLLYVLMVMAMGGLLMEGYLQNARAAAEEQKKLVDDDVLARAKAALLQYAYNYPVVNGRGPGRLPCADTDNDGLPNTGAVQCVSVGRFPWADPELNTSELKDSSGERLWYAVSGTFATNVLNNSPYVPATSKHAGGKRFINSEAVGTITIKDQSGAVIYDGAIDGVAAVIIAPGSPVARSGVLQDRSVSNSDDPDDLVPDTDPGITNPANYLDLNGVQDNATLTHLDSNDGFQLGPVFNAQNEVVINDRIVVVTAEEVLEMAQKSLLQMVGRSIDTWQGNIWGGNAAAYRYPWLDDYSLTPLTANVDSAVSTSGVIVGRLPVLDGKYFAINQYGAATYDTNKIDGDLVLSYKINDMDSDSIAIELPGALNNAFFKSTGPSPKIELKANLVLPATYSFFMVTDWPATPVSWWVRCPDDGNGIAEITDCSRDWTGAATPGQPNGRDATVRKVSISFHVAVNLELKDHDYVLPVVATYSPPTDTMDAMISPQLSGPGKNKIVSQLTVGGNPVYLKEYDYLAAPFPVPTVPVWTGSKGLAGQGIGISYFPEVPKWVWRDEDDWYDSILVSYVDGLKPSGGGTCTAGIDCLEIGNLSAGASREALVVLAGESAAGFVNQVDLIQVPGGIFDDENADGDRFYDARVPGGNDMVHILR